MRSSGAFPRANPTLLATRRCCPLWKSIPLSIARIGTDVRAVGPLPYDTPFAFPSRSRARSRMTNDSPVARRCSNLSSRISHRWARASAACWCSWRRSAFDARVRPCVFFTVLRKQFDRGVALEPRHASWFGDRADRLLNQFEVARVAADPREPKAEASQADGAGSRTFVFMARRGCTTPPMKTTFSIRSRTSCGTCDAVAFRRGVSSTTRRWARQRVTPYL